MRCSSRVWDVHVNGEVPLRTSARNVECVKNDTGDVLGHEFSRLVHRFREVGTDLRRRDSEHLGIGFDEHNELLLAVDLFRDVVQAGPPVLLLLLFVRGACTTMARRMGSAFSVAKMWRSFVLMWTMFSGAMRTFLPSDILKSFPTHGSQPKQRASSVPPTTTW